MMKVSLRPNSDRGVRLRVETDWLIVPRIVFVEPLSFLIRLPIGHRRQNDPQK